MAGHARCLTLPVRLALALQTLSGLTLLIAVAAGTEALLRVEPALRYPWSPLSPPRTAAVLVVVAVLWTLVNAPTEGRVLLSVSATRGVTVADLLAVPPLVLAGLLVLRELLRRA